MDLKMMLLCLILVCGVNRTRSDGRAALAAADRMEKQFLFLVSNIGEKINAAVKSVRDDLKSTNFRINTYGLALVTGGFEDCYADFVENSRSIQDLLTMPDVVYSYGYNLGYGYGFGGPYLLPSYLQDTRLDCTGRDFFSVVSSYGLLNGLAGTNVGEAKLNRLGVDSKTSVHCLLKHIEGYPEAAEVGYLIEDMVEAGVQTLRLRAAV